MMETKRYVVTLETLEPFRIGGPADPLTSQDNPVAIVGSRAAVPGSSLKGAFRSQIERHLIDGHYDVISATWQQQVALQPCLASPRLSQDEQVLVRQGKYRPSACMYPPASNPSRDRGSGRSNPSRTGSLCPACYLLGAQGLTGFVHVPFLFTDVAPEELYSARIDRVTGTVARGMNRTYQLVPPGVRFTGDLEVLIRDGLLGWDLGQPRPLGADQTGDAWLRTGEWDANRVLQELILDRLTSISWMGGYRSKGFGMVRITCMPSGGS